MRAFLLVIVHFLVCVFLCSTLSAFATEPSDGLLNLSDDSSIAALTIGNDPATLIFDFDNCNANTTDNSNCDYSEFTANISNSDAIALTVVNEHLYRLRPETQKHSCTPGNNNSSAMCVSFAPFCDYLPGSQEAVRFDIQVSPLMNQTVVLEKLSFLEKAPLMFEWINGSSGTNNFPQYYAIRILKNGAVVYEERDISTSQEWTLKELDFGTNDQFRVNETTVFNFELLAYCPVGYPTFLSIWDLEDISVTAVCADAVDNPIDGGVLTGGPFWFCTGDGIMDNIPANEVILTANVGPVSQWVITDESGVILSLPGSPADFDFENTGPGIAFLYNISHDGNITGLDIGSNIAMIMGNFDFSNSIVIDKNFTIGGEISGGPFSFCTQDGTADMISSGAITIMNSVGSESTWILADLNGLIILTASEYDEINFDSVMSGDYSLYLLSSNFELTGLSIGDPIVDLAGCFNLSNSESVTLTLCGNDLIDGGVLTGGPFWFCTGDGLVDNIPVNEVNLTSNVGPVSQWVITDESGVILSLPGSPSNFDFESTGPGIAFLYNISHDGNITGLDIGSNIAMIMGNFDFSNSIVIDKNFTIGGEISGGPFSFCSQDGIADIISSGAITIMNSVGSEITWVLTDPDGLIVTAVPDYAEIDFDMFMSGEYLLSLLSSNFEITGLTVGDPIMELSACHNLSNNLNISLSECNNIISGGTLSGGPFSFCAGDGLPDLITEVMLDGNAGLIMQWVITDNQGTIMSLPAMLNQFDFDVMNTSELALYNLSHDGSITGLSMGATISDLAGNFDLSNALEINIMMISGGILTGGPFEICLNDSLAVIPNNSLSLTEVIGSDSRWILTDNDSRIVRISEAYTDFNLDALIESAYTIYHLSTNTNDLNGLVQGNLVADLDGCYDLSNGVILNLIECIKATPNAGIISGNPGPLCIGNGRLSMVIPGTIELQDSEGTGQWVITDSLGLILGLTDVISDFDFELTADSLCYVQHLAYFETITGLEVGSNINSIEGCYDISNSIIIEKNYAAGGQLTDTPYHFCVGDGIEDRIPENAIILTDNIGEYTQWVLTDVTGTMILALPNDPSDLDFDSELPGTCTLWSISYNDELIGLEIGERFNTVQGCFSRSNFVSIRKSTTVGGIISGGPFEFCVQDGVTDTLGQNSIVSMDNQGTNQIWVLVDANNTISKLHTDYTNINFDPMDEGTYMIYLINYDSNIEGLLIGASIDNLSGCFSLSNPLPITMMSCRRLDSTVAMVINPNPSSDNIVLEFDQGVKNVSVTIVNGLGYIESYFVAKDGTDLSIDISTLDSGLYYAKVVIGHQLIIKSFLKI